MSLVMSTINDDLNWFFDNANYTDYETQKTDEGLTLYVDLPGVKKDDVVVFADNGRLTVEAKRKTTVEKKYKKSFSVSKNLDTSKLELSLSDGVLKITMPNLENKKSNIFKLK
jgi:HSP20 family protein